MTTVVYVLAGIEKALAFEWIATHMSKGKVALHFVLIGKANTPLQQFLTANQVPVTVLPYGGGKPALLGVTYKLYKLLRRLKPKTVHTHIFEANMAGLTAAWLARVPQRVYTRHHATLHHQYFPRAVWYDRYTNRLATAIVALCRAGITVLTEMDGAPKSKVRLIPHGFDLAQFGQVPAPRTEALRKKYQLPANAGPVVGVIARYTHWKGVQYVVPAFAQLRKENPQAHLILANARGDYAAAIEGLLAELPEGSYTQIAFEGDLPALYSLFDVYVHAPIDQYAEAFGQTYVEALAAGVPSVFTLSGIANDFVVDHRHALVVPYANTEAIVLNLRRLLGNEALRHKLVTEGQKVVHQHFALQRMVGALEDLYLE